MNYVKDARCLDAFAGSGALGLEAFSRGASQVVFIEQSAQAHTSLQKVLTQFNSPKLKLIKADACTYLQKTTEQYDIIFLDPPFALDYIPQCLTAIANKNLLPEGGLVYLESDHPIEVDMTQWKQLKQKQAGQVIYGLFQKLKA